MLKQILNILVIFALLPIGLAVAQPVDDDGSIGIEGVISSPPPSVGATISAPVNGAVFNDIPINVTGICPNNLLVKLFKNGVFSGSDLCVNGSYSIQTDLFSGQNDLVAIVFDELDQEGPSSNIVSVTYDDSQAIGPLERVLLNSAFARRGANPGQRLIWPVTVSGGQGPYAISVNWGDGGSDLVSVNAPGEFNIEHVYESSGTYTVIVQATDNVGRTAYLQLVAVANGPVGAISDTDGGGSGFGAGNGENVVVNTRRIIWQPTIVLIPMAVSTFWLGKKYQLKRIRTKIERGELPFNLG